MNTITFIVPGDPMGKQRPRVGQTTYAKASVFTPKQTRDYEERVKRAIFAQVPGLLPGDDYREYKRISQQYDRFMKIIKQLDKLPEFQTVKKLRAKADLTASDLYKLYVGVTPETAGAEQFQAYLATYEKWLDYMDGMAPLFSSSVFVNITAVYQVPKSTTKTMTAKMLSGEELPNKKPDVDNIAKIILDAMNGVLYADDAQVTLLVAHKEYGEVAGVKVEIEGYNIGD